MRIIRSLIKFVMRLINKDLNTNTKKYYRGRSRKSKHSDSDIYRY